MMYPAKPSPINSVLLVEGQSDKHVVWQLCGRGPSSFCITRDEYEFSVILPVESTAFLISEKGNRSELIMSIRQEIEAPSRRVVGILVDADDDLGKCWSDVVEGFSRTDVQLPSSPISGGTIIPERDHQPRIGIWLMPDNKSHGELEDFVLRMMPDGDTVWPLSHGYIENIRATDRKFTLEKTDKAKLYAWLATRKEPGRMGAAVGAYDLEIDGDLCQKFLTWLANLFG